MKEKGFTLIELLAVIVIIAIIALIATPIILNIINDTKDSSNKRSIELYGKAVENAIGRYQVKNPDDDDITIEKVQEYIEYKGNNIECETKVINKDGSVYLSNCRVNGVNIDYKYGKEPIFQLVTEENKTLAGKIPQGNFDLGDEYIVNVDGTHKYHFYVLGVEKDKVSLIMSNNICNDGTPETLSNCKVAWVSQADYNDIINYGQNGNNNKGPITAMNYLYEATKNWNNISNIQMNYTDEGNTGSYGYGTIKTNGNITTITKKDGITVTASYTNLKVRMPKISEIEGTGCTSSYGKCPAWMVNGLEAYTSKYPIGVKEDIVGIRGYWSLSSYGPVGVNNANNASFVHHYGYVYHREVRGNSMYGDLGLRPVIEVLKNNFL